MLPAGLSALTFAALWPVTCVTYEVGPLGGWAPGLPQTLSTASFLGCKSALEPVGTVGEGRGTGQCSGPLETF